MPNSSLDQLYAKFTPVAGAAPTDLGREIGYFDVFRLDGWPPGRRFEPPMALDRRDFYKISLNHGRTRIEYPDHAIEAGPDTLFVNTPRVAYRWLPQEPPRGYFCVFTDEFLRPARGQVALGELPVFRPDAYPVLTLTAADSAAAEAIFEKMAREITSTYAYKYDLLRAYLVELIHFVQKLQAASAAAPELVPAPAPAAGRVADRFAELLEQQFAAGVAPRLRTAGDYADALAVHVNYLNRTLKEATGHTTTALLAERTAQEAKLLLRQGRRNVSEIADYLGFADVAHFCTFFKRQTGRTPGDFRAA